MPDTIINDGPIAYISKITLPSGNTYYIKDEEARTEIQKIIDAAANGTHFIGVTSTELSDGDTTNPVIVDGNQVTAVAGDITILGTEGREEGAPKEFIFNGTAWQEFGSTGSLKGLAFQDRAYGDYTPEGYINKLDFSGIESTFSGTANVDITIDSSQTNFQGTEAQIPFTVTPSGSVEVKNRNPYTGETGNYIPKGTIDALTYTGDEQTIDFSHTPAGIVSTPAIQIDQPGETKQINVIDSVGTLPVLTTTVENENLTINFSQGTPPSTMLETVKAGADPTYKSSDLSFTGTQADFSIPFQSQGTVSTPEFHGMDSVIYAEFHGTSTTNTTTYTPEGRLGDIQVTSNQVPVTVTGVPKGTITDPVFTGQPATICVEADHAAPEPPHPEPEPLVEYRYEEINVESLDEGANPHELWLYEKDDETEEYNLTEDITVIEDKVYYRKYQYQEVDIEDAGPEANPAELEWYVKNINDEFILSEDDSIQEGITYYTKTIAIEENNEEEPGTEEPDESNN